MNKVKGIPGTISLSNDEKIANWQKLKFGMFIHWGLYSLLGGEWHGQPIKKGYSEQIQMWADIPESEYIKTAEQFHADKFDADEICQLAKKTGMSYIVVTSKHHDGFCMFDTKTTDYNIVEKTPFGKDPLKLLSEACERHGLKFGIYFSLVDWHQGHSYDEDNNNEISAPLEKTIENQLKELLTNYGPICEVWFDMSSPTRDQSEKFMQIVNTYQPDAMVNSRIWNNMGDFRTLNDNEIPNVNLDCVWQTPASIYRETWGYRNWQVRDNKNQKVKELLNGLLSGGNYLLNIGPRGDGSVVGFEADVLKEMGDWMNRHPNVVRAQDTKFEKPSWGIVKYEPNKLYMILEHIPENNKIELPGLVNHVQKVTEQTGKQGLDWEKRGSLLTIQLSPDFHQESLLPVLEAEIEGSLEIVPPHTVTAEQEKGMISSEDFYKIYGYHESGNYTSMQQVIVRYTAYVVFSATKNIYVSISSKAESNKMYRVIFGDTTFCIKGNQLNNSMIGPFRVEENQVYPLSIVLDNPSHVGEPLNIELDTIEIVNEN